MRYGMQYNLTKIISPYLTVKTPKDFRAICDTFTDQYSAMYSPEATFPQGGINIECFSLTAKVEKPPLSIIPAQSEGITPPEAARREFRDAFWDSLGGYTQTPVFVFEALRPGNTLLGPVLIEAKDTTYVIGPGWRFTLDFFNNGLLEEI